MTRWATRALVFGAAVTARVTVSEGATAAAGGGHAAAGYVPPLWSAAPFVAMLAAIAILPLVPRWAHLWHQNRHKLLLGLVLAVPVIAYYYFLHPALTTAEGEVLAGGWPVLGHVLSEALLDEYLPFIVLLFSLYTIGGGIQVDGDLRAHPRTNTAFLGLGALLGSLIGTTGAAMVLIRPLLQTNAERKRVRHTVIFFIFLVCNIGGCLLPIGDPPLFLGYLRGVPFLWTLRLAGPWLFTVGLLLAVYYAWDLRAYRRERPQDVAFDETAYERLHFHGLINVPYLAGVVLAVAFLVPGQPFVLAPSFIVPTHLREGVQLMLVGLSWWTTPRGVRRAHQFTFAPIAEVAALFIGVFLTMQTPIEILRVRGPLLGLTEPWQFFWATGSLSSFLDNAPTYVVFFETAGSLTHSPGPGVLALTTRAGFIRQDLLVAVSLGAVFMGANTYIGNGPNFMVKAIAEERGVKMPHFFGFVFYSLAVLMPVFVVVTFLCFVLGWL
jgi:Na+/H+ antiporter NhaD/arsenite permease-like protein